MPGAFDEFLSQETPVATAPRGKGAFDEFLQQEPLPQEAAFSAARTRVGNKARAKLQSINYSDPGLEEQAANEADAERTLALALGGGRLNERGIPQWPGQVAAPDVQSTDRQEISAPYTPGFIENASLNLRNLGQGATEGAREISTGLAGALATPLGMKIPEVPYNENGMAHAQGKAGFIGKQGVELAPWLIPGGGGAVGAALSIGGERGQRALASGDNALLATVKGGLAGGTALAAPMIAGKVAAPYLGAGASKLAGALSGRFGPEIAGAVSRTAEATGHGLIGGAAIPAGQAGAELATGEPDEALRQIESIPSSMMTMGGLAAILHGGGELAGGIQRGAQSRTEQKFSNYPTQYGLDPVTDLPADRTLSIEPGENPRPIADIGLDRSQPDMPGARAPITEGPANTPVTPEDLAAIRNRRSPGTPLDLATPETVEMERSPFDAPTDAGTATVDEAEAFKQQLAADSAKRDAAFAAMEANAQAPAEAETDATRMQAPFDDMLQVAGVSRARRRALEKAQEADNESTAELAPYRPNVVPEAPSAATTQTAPPVRIPTVMSESFRKGMQPKDAPRRIIPEPADASTQMAPPISHVGDVETKLIQSMKPGAARRQAIRDYLAKGREPDPAVAIDELLTPAKDTQAVAHEQGIPTPEAQAQSTDAITKALAAERAPKLGTPDAQGPRTSPLPISGQEGPQGKAEEPVRVRESDNAEVPAKQTSGEIAPALPEVTGVPERTNQDNHVIQTPKGPRRVTVTAGTNEDGTASIQRIKLHAPNGSYEIHNAPDNSFPDIPSAISAGHDLVDQHFRQRESTNAPSQLNEKPPAAHIASASKPPEVPAPGEAPVREGVASRAEEVQPGSAKPVEPEASVTGIKNSVSDAERERLNLPKRETPEGRTFDEMYEAGKAKAASDPLAASKLIDELRANPEKIINSESEAGLLLKHKVDLENDLHRLVAASERAKSEGDANGELIAQTQLDEHRRASKEFTELMERSGTAAGRALAARKMMSAMDYSLSHMESMAEAAKGSKLKDNELARIKALHEELAAKNAALEKKLEEVSKKAAKPETKKSEAAKPSNTILHAFGTAAESARARIKARGLRLKTGIDPLEIADYAIIGADHIANGVAKLADWSAKMVGEFGDQIKPHLEQIFAAANKDFEKRSKTRSDESLNKSYQKRMGKQIGDIESKLEKKDFSPAEKRKKPNYDAETLRLQSELESAKRRWNAELRVFERASRSKAQAVGATIKGAPGFFKSLKASLDDSAVFRQGWRVAFTNPIIWQRNALKTFSDAVKTFGGKEVMDHVRAEIKLNPYYEQAKQAKLAIGTTEEDFPTSLPEKVPFLGRVYKASENAFTAFQYRNRIQVFEKMMDAAKASKVDITDQRQLRSIGKLVNSLTSRGHLGPVEPVANVLNNVFFSARKIKADLDFLTAHVVSHLSKDGFSSFAQKQAIYNLAKVVAGTAAIMAIARTISPQSVELDPRSADFGKIRAGNTRYDITGGAGPLVTLATRLIRGTSKNSITGEIKPTTIGNIGQFFENKLSPTASVGFKHLESWLDATKEHTKKRTAMDDAKDLLVPMAISNFNELMHDTGATPATVGSGVLADFFGVGVNTYGAKEREKPQYKSIYSPSVPK